MLHVQVTDDLSGGSSAESTVDAAGLLKLSPEQLDLDSGAANVMMSFIDELRAQIFPPDAASLSPHDGGGGGGGGSVQQQQAAVEIKHLRATNEQLA